MSRGPTLEVQTYHDEEGYSFSVRIDSGRDAWTSNPIRLTAQDREGAMREVVAQTAALRKVLAPEDYAPGGSGKFTCHGCHRKGITTPAEVEAHKLLHGLVTQDEVAA